MGTMVPNDASKPASCAGLPGTALPRYFLSAQRGCSGVFLQSTGASCHVLSEPVGNVANTPPDATENSSASAEASVSFFIPYSFY